ncbi:LAMI_0B05644g1_1 [Lachancea mirantina]|uniref:Glucosidase 2 subunit beta n=1 Tax=Lachancea mirantina TaxID=1230905 RepID=A0A1G4IWK6_9SACH|nr:LAMI_0B05644g1_1 [Lachancea mirantina]
MRSYFGLFLLLQSQFIEAGIRGVSPESQLLYEPLDTETGQWACLGDPSVIIHHSQINDDFCDCLDGSDEPGTSACGSKSRFYCQNEGFAPRFVSGFKVNDGVCDCCDCQDEDDGGSRAWMESPGCKELRSEYDTLVEKELNQHYEGLTVLRAMQNSLGIDVKTDHNPNVQVETEQMKHIVLGLSNQLEDCKQKVQEMRKIYNDRMQAENPLMHQYEQLDIPFLTATTDSFFMSVERSSRAYHEVVELLEKLVLSYNRNLNDEAVNDVVKKYLDFSDELFDKINVNSALDVSHREQIKEYLEVELRDLLSTGQSRYPARAITGKFQTVRAIITARSEYYKELSKTLKFLTGLLDSLSENYNVNFQDVGVKDTVLAYKEFLAKSAGVTDPLSFPSKFIDGLDRLSELVTQASSTVLTPESQSSGSFSLTLINFFRELAEKFGFTTSSLASLRGDIAARELKCSQLRKELKTKDMALMKLLRLQTEEGESAQSKLAATAQVEELLQKLDPSCVEQVVGNYVYQLCLNPTDGVITQTDDKPNGNTVFIGRFSRLFFDENASSQNYIDRLRLQHMDTDLISHLESDVGNFQQEMLIGNLPNINNGLVIEYKNGDRCWNGPLRSAQLFFRCAKTFSIQNVDEPTRCNYSFEINGPLGCSYNFVYRPPAWSQ